MPTPSYGPRAGQYLSQAEYEAYVKQYGIGKWTWTDEEQAAQYNAGVDAVGGSSGDYQTPAQWRAENDRITAINAANGVTAGGNVNLPITQQTYQEAQAAGAQNPWFDFYRGQMTGGVQSSNPFQVANQGQARAEQQRVIQDLQRQAAGDMNSLAQQQLRQGYGAAQAQQSSLGSTMRGQSAGAAMRGVQQGQQGIQRGFAGDQQMLKLQEQQAAQAMLAQMLGQQQQQDIGQAQGVANATLNDQQLNDAMRQFYMGGAIQQSLGDLQYNSELGRARLGFDLDAQDVRAAQFRNAAQSLATAVGTVSGMGGRGSNSYNTDYLNGLTPSDPSEWAPYPGSNSIVPEDDK